MSATKSLLFGLFFLAAFSLFSSYALAASTMKLQGSREEIAKQLESEFPSGIAQPEVVRMLVEKYGVPKDQINASKVDKTPLQATSKGKKIEIYSWLTATICEYRSIRFLFAKSTVGAQFNFDKEQKLVSVDAIVSRGPEL